MIQLRRILVVLFVVLGAAPAIAADNTAPWLICFPHEQGPALLAAVEDRDDLRDYVTDLKLEVKAHEEYEAKVEGALTTCTDAFADCRKSQVESDNACMEAVKEAKGTWWQRARNAGGWAGVGAVLMLIVLVLVP